ncbi:MAG TPA: hypothetical protein VGN36_01605, partial [Sphingorhabdus sp.]|nr:hypothetical protein [Sphingorhabdus sp.]
MREPPLRVRILGHPIVMIPVMGMGLFILYQWTQAPENGVLAIAALGTMVLVGKASERRMEFVRWRKAWNAMTDHAEPAPQGPMLAKLAIAVIVPAGFMAHEAGALDVLSGPATGFGLIAVALFAGTMMVRRWRRSRASARPASQGDVVSVCAKPV